MLFIIVYFVCGFKVDLFEFDGVLVVIGDMVSVL